MTITQQRIDRWAKNIEYLGLGMLCGALAGAILTIVLLICAYVKLELSL